MRRRLDGFLASHYLRLTGEAHADFVYRPPSWTSEAARMLKMSSARPVDALMRAVNDFIFARRKWAAVPLSSDEEARAVPRSASTFDSSAERGVILAAESLRSSQPRGFSIGEPQAQSPSLLTWMRRTESCPPTTRNLCTL